MLANLRKFITKTEEAKLSREVEAQIEYAALLAKIAADGEISDGEVEAESHTAMALFDELGLTLEDVEKDAKVYLERLQCIAHFDRLESLTAIETKAKAAYDKADEAYHDAVNRLNQLRHEAADIYQDASRKVTDARHAGELLRRLQPSWMRRKQALIDRMPVTPWTKDGGDKPPVAEHPAALKAALDQHAGQTTVWPLPTSIAPVEIDQQGHLLP